MVDRLEGILILADEGDKKKDPGFEPGSSEDRFIRAA
jgi:hypothetical protein